VTKRLFAPWMVLGACTSFSGAPRGDTTVMPPADAGPEDAGEPRIDCLGELRPAIFCDGFESSLVDARWTPVLVPTSPPADLALNDTLANGGRRSLTSGFSLLTEGGQARLRFRVPSPAPSLALQVWIRVREDAYGPNSSFPLVKVAGTTETASVVLATPGGARRFEIRFPAEPAIDLGAIEVGGWTCVELVHANGTLTGRRPTSTFPTRPFLEPIESVEIGMEWLYGSGTESMYFDFDDVIVARQPAGCVIGK
jgi:hypothetical protein